MGLSLGSIVQVVEADVVAFEVDSAELAAGQTVEVPGHITIGSTGGKPVYLFGILSTDASYSPSESATAPVLSASLSATKTAGG